MSEKKYIVADFARAGFKMLDTDNGGFEGYGNTTGLLDDVADITVDGAFKETITDFLADGWVAPDHEWGVKHALGIFTEAKEDDTGLYVVAAFHSTPDAQLVRTKTRERLDAGKSVKLSIGYEIIEGRYVDGKTAVGYLKNPTPEEVARCEKMTRVRLLLKLKLYEVSLVSVPANSASVVASAKSTVAGGIKREDGTIIDIKSQYLGGYVEESITFSALYDLVDRLVWHAAYDAIYGSEPKADRIALMSGAIMELHDYMIRFMEAILSDDATEDAKALLITELKAHIDLHQAKDAASLSEATMIEHTEAVLTAAKGLLDRRKAINALNLKEGRSISTATSARLLPHASALKEIAADIEDLATVTKEEEVESVGTGTDDTGDAKSGGQPTETSTTDVQTSDIAAEARNIYAGFINATLDA